MCLKCIPTVQSSPVSMYVVHNKTKTHKFHLRFVNKFEIKYKHACLEEPYYCLDLLRF